MKKFPFFFVCLLAAITLFSIKANAQITIGSSEEPASGAVLDLSKVSTKDLGLLLPQVSLTALSSWAPLPGENEGIEGMLVYNTNASIGTGIYYWKNKQWMVLATAAASADSWSVNGNAGTNEETSFIGTTDNKPLALRVRNEHAGHIGNYIIEVGGGRPDSIANVSYGWMALQNSRDGHSNTAIGTYALNQANRQDYLGKGNIASFNTAIGAKALEWCATGSGNIAVGAYAMEYGIGSGNVAIGQNALQRNLGGSNVAIGTFALSDSRLGIEPKDSIASENIAIGQSALQNNLASRNTAIGHEAANNNSTGGMLVALGRFALRSNTTGSQNTAVGYNALNDNVSGNLNTAIGSQSMPGNAGGDFNTAVGAKSLFNNIGHYNTAIGVQTMNDNTTGSSNTGVGSGALYSNTEAIWNTGVGTSALWFNTTGKENTAAGGEALAGNRGGSWNTAVGTRALWSVHLTEHDHIKGFENANPLGMEMANENTAIGYESLKAVTSGYENTAVGSHSMSQNSSGKQNVAVGRTALNRNTDGEGNTAIGFTALGSNTEGKYNTAIGYEAMQSTMTTTTGSYNTAIGTGAMQSNTTGSYNTAIGSQAYIVNGDLTNSTAIGSGAGAWKSNQVIIGGVHVTSIGGVVNWTRTSDMISMEGEKRNIGSVPGLSFINELNPITYNYQDANWIRPEFRAILFSGFRASEVRTAASNVGYDFSGVDAEDGLRYSDFVVPLVQAVKELSAKNESLQAQIDELRGLLNQ